MSDINYLTGTKDVSNQPMEPYSETVCSFAAALSGAIMKHPEAGTYTDVMSFAFWCRRANLLQKKNQWEERKERRLGRGLAFHIAPSNVPVNFAFSYMFSLLAGNANIVRVPSRAFPQVLLISRVMNEVLKDYPEIQKRTAMIQYPADNEITAELSKMADVRVIWGGDTTVSTIRSCMTKPKCIDLVFADRYSTCILDGKAIAETDSRGIKKLAEAFYNDTYLMDQNACSSPQIIFWRNASEEVKTCFWRAVFEYAKKKYQLQAASCVDKYTKLCMEAITLPEAKQSVNMENLIYRLELNALPEDITKLRGSCGYFYEYDLQCYEELIPAVTEKVQTVTCYGIDPAEIQEFVINHQLRGIDRIVPVGKSLDIDVIWDGYDIVGMLSRLVEVRN